MYGPLVDRFDLLLVDNRGTGRSGVIDCNALQHRGINATNVGECARQIGPHRDLYRSASVARDLDAVRGALGIGKIDLYGFSWGSLQARAYAVRFGDHLRSLVLDSAGQNLDVVAWASERGRLYGDQVALLCRRSPTCRAVGEDPIARVAALARPRAAAPEGHGGRGGLPTRTARSEHGAEHRMNLAHGAGVDTSAAEGADEPRTASRSSASVRRSRAWARCACG